MTVKLCVHLLQFWSISVALRHELRSIAVAADVCFLTRLPDLMLLALTQYDVQRAQILFEPIHLRGTRNGEDVIAYYVSCCSLQVKLV
jgi:hypothetical protein